LPRDIEVIYADLEEKIPLRLSADVQLKYYAEFTRKALGGTTLHFGDVEAIIYRLNPEIMISKFEFWTLMTSTCLELSKGAKDQPEPSEYIDFKHFAVLMYHLIKHHSDATKAKTGKWNFKSVLDIFPIDPDSAPKQFWDTFCMLLLLYCSFSVPFNIAFDDIEQDQQMGDKQRFETAVDVLFMLDMLLNFITAWDNQGFMVRELPSIARNYLRTWFLPDLAGSVPFDKLIASFIEADGPSVGSLNLFRGLRLVRMLKLVRALRFINKLEKLKQNEGFEAFGAAITLASAAFALFFTAHVLGCFYVILLAYEDPAHNWLANYSPEVAAGGASERYVVSLYWAIVTIRCAPDAVAMAAATRAIPMPITATIAMTRAIAMSGRTQ
jgi:hypothetical protein